MGEEGGVAVECELIGCSKKRGTRATNVNETELDRLMGSKCCVVR